MPDPGYAYIGPTDLFTTTSTGDPIHSPPDATTWLGARPADELSEPFTFVVDLTGVLRLAPRRSEHVACAGGARVLAAGEIGFERVGGGWVVDEVSNQSTGYCPDVTSWTAVATALRRAGLAHPPGFTHEVVFRRCPGCREVGIVREGDYVCVFCGSGLPTEWNV